MLVIAGSFGTIEMVPSKVGYWRLDCETAEYMQEGMRAVFLVYDSSGYYLLLLPIHPWNKFG